MRPLHTARLAACALLALFACGPGVSPSRAAPEAKVPVEPKEAWVSSDRIPDFSFAGYHMGEAPIPDVAAVTRAEAFGVKGDGVTDDTLALRSALEATRDGALVLPRGRFVLRDTLRIPRSRVVLRGQGPRETVLVMPDPLFEIHPPGDPLHGQHFGFVEARGEDPGARLAAVTARAKRGDHEIEINPALALRPGEIIRLRMDNSDALLRQLLGGLEPGPRTPEDYPHYVDWASPVARADGTRVRLARPLRVDVEPTWKAEILAFQPTLEEIGVEHLSFEFPGRAKAPHPSDDGYHAIYLRGVVNGWVRDVDIVDSDNGVVLEDCRFLRVEAVRLRARVRPAPSGHHALWAKQSQDCVFSDFEIETQFEDEVTVEAFANGNVFMHGRAQALGLDHHRNAPYENLFTDLDAGSPARLWKSGGDAARGPHAGVRETLWNIRHRGHPPALPGALHFDRPDSGWPLLNVFQVAGYERTSEDASVWIDSFPRAPENLYEAQLALRLGRIVAL